MKKRHQLLLTAILTLLALVLFGTALFNHIEHWSFVDSFFYTTMTVTTIGYGDLNPTHDLSKIITAMYALITIPIALFVFGLIAEEYLETRLGHFERKVHEIITREKEIEQEIVEKITS